MQHPSVNPEEKAGELCGKGNRETFDTMKEGLETIWLDTQEIDIGWSQKSEQSNATIHCCVMRARMVATWLFGYDQPLAVLRH